MKVLVLHPPMYPVNYEFYNYLGKHVDLTIFQFGVYPSDHPTWTSSSLSKMRHNFKLKVFGTGSDSIKNQFYSIQLKEVKLINPDLVLSIAFWMPSLYFSILSKFFDFKFLILTNAIEATDGGNSILRGIYRKLICLNTATFISASELSSEYLKFLSSTNKIELSIQTIETKQWREKVLQLKSKHHLREELGFPQDKNIILGVGNFSYKKNWISVMKIMDKIDNCIFVLVGSGENYKNYMSYINENHLESKIILIDRKEGTELKKYFKLSDLFILPSLYEQFGFVVVEALSSDLPVICSKNTGASSLIKDGYNGYTINPSDDFSFLIKKTINNLNIMQKNAYKSIKNNTLENRSNEFYSIFKKVLD